MGHDTRSARAFRVRRPGQGEIVERDLPAPGPDEVLVRTLYSGISRGTETLVFLGRVPADQYGRMRAPFQQGEFPGPVIHGYSNVGRVEAGPMQGREVFCLFPHQTAYVVPADAVVPLPEGLPAGRAVLAAGMETAVNALWDAGPRIGDRVAVVGGGVIGCLVAALCVRLPGARVELVDIDPERAEVAEALGAAFRLPGAGTGDCDLVFHASGRGEGLREALTLAGFAATVLELSWFGDHEPTLPLGGDFHSRRLTLRSSQVSTVAPSRSARRAHRDRMALALELLRDPVFDRLISGEDAFEELPSVMARLASGSGGDLCRRVRYDPVPD